MDVLTSASRVVWSRSLRIVAHVEEKEAASGIGRHNAMTLMQSSFSASVSDMREAILEWATEWKSGEGEREEWRCLLVAHLKVCSIAERGVGATVPTPVG